MYVKDYILGLINSGKPADMLFLSALIMLWLTSLALAISVAWKFSEYAGFAGKREKTGGKKHAVETFSMTAVIVVFFNLLQTGIGAYSPRLSTWVLFQVFGFALAIAGVVLHIWSKFEIGKHWSNQIEILSDHKLVTSGPYAIVRHPMYASIIMWMIGLSLVFVNYAGLALTFIIYVPMMIFRANDEDLFLSQIDKAAFDIYKADTYQLIPKFKDPVSLLFKLIVIAMLGFTLIMKQMTPERFVLLFMAHFIAGLISYIPKVRFSFMNKSFIMLIFYIFYMFFSPAFWLFYAVLIFDIYGLFADCPCMWIYGKYSGCPCFGFIKKCLTGNVK
jgi:protein-S-isoprenylcysteine O-methyltransferase Ste14